ncbi:ABC transporter ATP-binding protein [Streptococcus sp. DD12]|uniref:ABC transporter ATP-binding protein n=1 Tax=Streptococcus sp. DD12 TaxID=1777880 RepID=UPI0007974109|nr:ABC transporter ATP-binding protein [Streptococcus sp. DD12]KXT76520.1 ABC transporter, ATP-binding/permease protein [Streptococcus sp. DD12]
MKARNSRQVIAEIGSDFLPQKSLLLFALLGTIVQVALTAYLPLLIGDAVNAVVSSHPWQSLFPILLRMAWVILINTLIQWLNPLLYNRLVYRYTARLRQRTIAKLHQLPLAYLDRHSVGDLVARVTADTEQLSNGLLMVFNQFLVGVLTLLFTVIAMAKLDLVMMLVTVCLTPLSIILARFIANKSYHLYQEQTKSRGQQTQMVEELIQQEEVVQAFNAQEQMIQAFNEVNGRYADYSQDAIFYSSTVNPATRLINALIYALLVGIGAMRIMSGNFSVGALTAFLNYVTQYTKPFNDISAVFAELQSALACGDRLYMVLAQESLTETGQETLTIAQNQGAVTFEHVSFGYVPEQTLLEDISIAIPAGSKVAIVGPTGAGKSTLINLLMRFYEVNQGQILIDGVPVTDYTRESLRSQIGMVLQETWLETATVADNIAYGHPTASRAEVIAAAKAAKADFFIRQLPQGYDTFLADAGASLSQGQRQLLAIARLFVKVPEILILDEATSSIDTRTEVLIQEAFEKLMAGRTSFIIAHRLSTIQNADIILVMVAGNIVEHGNHSQLMAQKGVYFDMQTAQEQLS